MAYTTQYKFRPILIRRVIEKNLQKKTKTQTQNFFVANVTRFTCMLKLEFPRRFYFQRTSVFRVKVQNNHYGHCYENDQCHYDATFTISYLIIEQHQFFVSFTQFSIKFANIAKSNYTGNDSTRTHTDHN